MRTPTRPPPVTGRDRKIQTNLKLTPTAERLLLRIATLWGVAQGDVVEMLIRAMMHQLGPAKEYRSTPNVPTSTEAKDQNNVRLTAHARRGLVYLASLWDKPRGTVVEILLRLEAARIELAGGKPTAPPWPPKGVGK